MTWNSGVAATPTVFASAMSCSITRDLGRLHVGSQLIRVQPGARQDGSDPVGEGWKDTVLVMPGERVRVLHDYPGLFLYYCHMLEHEDSGLMRNYLVQA